MRKTIAVAQVVENVNNMLRESHDSERDTRQGMIVTLENILFQTDNYRGYSYLPSELDSDGNLRPEYDGTRRRYS